MIHVLNATDLILQNGKFYVCERHLKNFLKIQTLQALQMRETGSLSVACVCFFCPTCERQIKQNSTQNFKQFLLNRRMRGEGWRRKEGRKRERWGGEVGREEGRERWHISRFYFEMVQVSRYSNLKYSLFLRNRKRCIRNCDEMIRAELGTRTHAVWDLAQYFPCTTLFPTLSQRE